MRKKKKKTKMMTIKQKVRRERCVGQMEIRML